MLKDKDERELIRDESFHGSFGLLKIIPPPTLTPATAALEFVVVGKFVGSPEVGDHRVVVVERERRNEVGESRQRDSSRPGEKLPNGDSEPESVEDGIGDSPSEPNCFCTKYCCC